MPNRYSLLITKFRRYSMGGRRGGAMYMKSWVTIKLLQFFERKAKNYRFFAFRRNFQIHGMGSRSSKMLKISYGRPWKLVNMTNDRINMIFDCGSWSPFIFSYFTSDIMGGRMGGRQYLMIKITSISKNRNFWVKKCFRSNWNAPPAPPHVCQKSPHHPPLHFSAPPSAPPWTPLM